MTAGSATIGATVHGASPIGRSGTPAARATGTSQTKETEGEEGDKMKLLQYLDQGQPRLGILEGDTVYQAEGDLFTNPRKGAAVGPFDQQTILPPVVNPSKIVAIGLNYAAHVTENDPNRVAPTEPVIFMKPQTALIGQGAAIELPDHNRTDCEAEFCIVMGKTAYRVSEDEALSYVLGYTCGNDVSERVQQRKDGQWVRAKGYNTFAPLGPVIETELDIDNLDISSYQNGELRQHSNTSNMIFKPAFLVSFISNVMTLLPGDVIMTGTPEGVWQLNPGDTVEVRIEGIGTLRNQVVMRE
jgi:2-keto-4-pentenoate hydratase/2-oxohepta-3-ene-1,7-dioic acid hydratase in catechol pathway